MSERACFSNELRTVVQFNYLPTLRAQPRQCSGAIEALQAAGNKGIGALYPVFERGEAFLAAQHDAEALPNSKKSSTIAVVVNGPIGAHSYPHCRQNGSAKLQ